MSDELERFARALRADAPRPSAGARERAVAAALAAFDRRRQGIGDGARHKERTPRRGVTSLPGRLAMSFTSSFRRPRFAFAAGTGLALVAGAALVVHLFPVAPTAPPPLLASVESLPGAAGPGDRSGALMRTSPPVEVARRSREPASPALRSEIPPLGGAVVQSVTETPSLSMEMEASRSAPSPSMEMEMQMEMQMAVPASRSRGLSMVPGSLSMARGLSDDDAEPAFRRGVQGRDRFAAFDPNPVRVAAEHPVSTFSVDVDTASYAFARASLNRGALPPPDSVRVEELVNYFPYGYEPPASRERPFAVHAALMPAPWNGGARLLRIGLQGYRLERAAAPPANLVFLIDVSGSMDEPDKLPLLVASLRLLLDSLAPDDTVAIVVYAGAAGTVLEPTRAAERGRILAALESLRAGGSTAGGEGLRQAYLLAERRFVEGGVNRVILATDGDFNVGIADPDELEGFVARKRESGVYLSVLGFGMGNYNDALMQRLAQNGNGAAAYVDGLPEARKALVEEASSMLFPIAGDVKVQVEFNPASVAEYRLIGYETRLLAREDFANDGVDAGEVGAGHAVTALYEVAPVGSDARRVEPLRYRREAGEAAADAGAFADEIAFVKVRYRLPGSGAVDEIARAVTAADAFGSVDAAPADLRFAAAVAGFGQLLRGGRYTGAFGYDDVVALAQGAKGDDPFGYRAEFVGLARLAKSAAAMAPPVE